MRFDDTAADADPPPPPQESEVAEASPLSFDVGTHVFAHVQETNRLGEPCAWVLLEFVRGETDSLRQGSVFIRLLAASPAPPPQQRFSVLCGDHVALPRVGGNKRYSLNKLNRKV